jgi:endonuclease/exonuclease/phosphatase family metal-dependent hydrolase
MRAGLTSENLLQKVLRMTLRILSYNILAGGENRLPLIASVIQQERPDIVALQEARNRSNAEALAQQLNMSFTIGEAHNANKDHVVLLSRLQVTHAENHPFPILAKTLLEIEVIWEGMPLAIFTTHLKAGQDLESEQRRIAEMQTILQLLQTHHNQSQILVGDFNTLHPADKANISAYVDVLRARGKEAPAPQFPRRVIPLLLEAGYVDCYRALHPFIPGDTSYTSHQALRVDYIFASSSLAERLSACEIINEGDAKIASDHFPLWAEFI